MAQAEIAVLSTRQRTVSDSRGRFELTGLTGTSVTLRVRRIPFAAKEVEARVGDTELRVELSLVSRLQEVVVTGTPGDQVRREVGNAVARVNISEQVASAPALSLGQQLNARAPGVNISPPNGVAGGGERIQLRGRTTLTLRSTPLIFVDGIRVDGQLATGGFNVSGQTSRLNDFDPSEIESVEILMGPAAGTLYGTEASSGVIQILTKRGESGPARVTAQIRTGASFIPNPEGIFPTNWFRDPATNEVKGFNLVAAETERGTPLFRTGLNQGYAVDVSGGTDAVKYYGAFHFNSDEGPIASNKVDRYGGRLNVTATPHPKWDANAQFGFNLNRGDYPHTLYVANAVLSRATTRDTPSRGFLVGFPSQVYNDHFQYEHNVDHFTLGGEVRHRPFPWLSHRFRAGVDLSNGDQILLAKRVPPPDNVFFSPTAAAGSKTIDVRNLATTSLDYSATAVHELSSDLKLATSVGAQHYRSELTTLQATGRTFPSPGVTTLAGAATTFGSDNLIENITAGVYGQAQLTWHDRLYVTAALRADGNSSFGKAFGLATYPKVSASWVLSEEPFWKLPFFDNLRLRAAWGKSGQQPLAFASLRTFQPVTGPGGGTAVTPQFVGNDSLGPEIAREVEVGLDASLFRQRVGLSFTYYDARTKDVILLREVAPSSGFPQTQFVNAGELHNWGFETLVDLGLIRSAAVTWNLGLNLALSQNEVVRLGLPGQEFLQFGVGYRFQPGFPAYGAFTRRIIQAERGPNNQSINILCDGGLPGSLPGGAGVPCDQAPRLFQGRTDPKWSGAISSQVHLWNRLSVSGLVDFRAGHIKFSDQYWCGGLLGCENKVRPELYDPIIVAYTQLAAGDLAEWQYDATFAKLREVSVSYQLPRPWARRLGAAGGTISISGRNLHTWASSFKATDPEAAGGFQDGGGGNSIESEVVPQTRFFTLLLNLRF